MKGMNVSATESTGLEVESSTAGNGSCAESTTCIYPPCLALFGALFSYAELSIVTAILIVLSVVLVVVGRAMLRNGVRGGKVLVDTGCAIEEELALNKIESGLRGGADELESGPGKTQKFGSSDEIY